MVPTKHVTSKILKKCGFCSEIKEKEQKQKKKWKRSQDFAEI